MAFQKSSSIIDQRDLTLRIKHVNVNSKNYMFPKHNGCQHNSSSSIHFDVWPRFQFVISFFVLTVPSYFSSTSSSSFTLPLLTSIIFTFFLHPLPPLPRFFIPVSDIFFRPRALAFLVNFLITYVDCNYF